MFWDHYYKSILRAFRDREIIVWLLLFPFILSTLFFFTFSALDTVDQLKVIPVGIVEDEAYQKDAVFAAALHAVSDEKEGGAPLFSVRGFADAAAADQQLEAGEIDGYIRMVQGSPSLVVKDDGLNQTIIKSFLDQYLQRKNGIADILRKNPSAAKDMASYFAQQALTQEISLTQNPPTNKINYYYALLAMVCMYGGLQGMQMVACLQPNLSSLGARRSLSPVPRMRLLAADMLGCLTVNFFCLAVLVGYHAAVLKINYGRQIGFVLLTCLAGSLVGIFFGAMISVSAKLKSGAKVAIVVTVTMACSFLAGLMVSGINYLIAQNLPVLAWLNPAARITDAFYCLYYYDGYGRYFLNLGVLLGMAAAMFGITVFFVRRQRYENI